MMGILTVNTDFEKLYGITEREYYSKQYLTFDISSLGIYDGVEITIGQYVDRSHVKSISYSLDGGENWTTVENKHNEEVTIWIEKENDKQNKVLLKGDAVQFAKNDQPHPEERTVISVDGEFEVSGNILSLLYGDDFIGKSLPNYADNFCELFRDTSIVCAKNLILPNNVKQSCYSAMFLDCASLTDAPELPATTLALSCYLAMFKGCTSLEKAPELPATSLWSYCYYQMFDGCTKLNYVKCYATTYTTNDNLHYWLRNVASVGTFYKDFTANYSSGNDGIPTGWTKIAIDLPTPTQTVNFVPNAGGLLEGSEVSLRASGKKTGIKFTTDGSNPTAESKTYENGDIVIEEATTVKAAAFNADDVDFKLGPISTAEYTIITPSLTIYVDKFPTAEQIEQEELDDIYDNAGMTRAEYMQAEAADPEDFHPDEYVYYGQSINIGATTYYIWKMIAGGADFFLATTTADYDTLSAQSIAEEGDVPFTSMFALVTIEDDEVDVYEENAESAMPRQLVKIEHYSDGE